MINTLTVVTATRAEYGLLAPLIKALAECGRFRVRIAATGAHLSPEFGLTYREIEEDGYTIDRKIEILLSSDTPSSITKSMGLAMLGFADYFAEARPDALMILGDRYETLAVALAAMNAGIPIVHLYGGETTEGAIDEAVRHAITKLGYLHFTSTELYRRRVIQLGEAPERVFTVGAMGIENALRLPLINRAELEADLGFKLDRPYAVVTYHPVTLEDSTAGEQCREILRALDGRPEMKYIFTRANADAGGRIINEMLEEYAAVHDNAVLADSLGQVRYLSALKYATMVIGNSSSGLTEAPSFHIPTVNIGDRQKGRLQAESVISCPPDCESIGRAVDMALSPEIRKKAAEAENPYGDGDTSRKIVEILCRELGDKEHINLKKKFYDVDFSIPNFL